MTAYSFEPGLSIYHDVLVVLDAARAWSDTHDVTASVPDFRVDHLRQQMGGPRLVAAIERLIDDAEQFITEEEEGGR